MVKLLNSPTQNGHQHRIAYCKPFKTLRSSAGYAAFQLPVGRLSEKYACGKHLIGFGVLASGLLTLISPLVLDLGAVPFILVRFLVGVVQAPILCCSYTMFAEWLPKAKRGNATTWCNVGFEFGGMISFFLTGYISSIDSLGWRYAFYLFSIVSFVWVVPFYFMVSLIKEKFESLMPSRASSDGILTATVDLPTNRCTRFRKRIRICPNTSAGSSSANERPNICRTRRARTRTRKATASRGWSKCRPSSASELF